METHPIAFISYSWDSPEHCEWVKKLATRLREAGIDVILDHWHAQPGDKLPAFMSDSIAKANFVLIICTPAYKEKSQREAGGVNYEEDIITSELFIRQNQRKYIPILRDGEWKEVAPNWLLGKYYIDLRDIAGGRAYSEANYQTLLRSLRGEQLEAPPIGSYGKKSPVSNSASSSPDIATKKNSVAEQEPGTLKITPPVINTYTPKNPPLSWWKKMPEAIQVAILGGIFLVTGAIIAGIFSFLSSPNVCLLTPICRTPTPTNTPSPTATETVTTTITLSPIVSETAASAAALSPTRIETSVPSISLVPTITQTVAPSSSPSPTLTETASPTPLPAYLQACFPSNLANPRIEISNLANLPAVDGTIVQANDWDNWQRLQASDDSGSSACVAYAVEATNQFIYIAIQVCDDKFIAQAPSSNFSLPTVFSKDTFQELVFDLLLVRMKLSNQQEFAGYISFPRKNNISENRMLLFFANNHNAQICQSIEMRVENSLPANVINTFELGIDYVDFDNNSVVTFLSSAEEAGGTITFDLVQSN